MDTSAFVGSGVFNGSFAPADMSAASRPLDDVYTLQGVICLRRIVLEGKGGSSGLPWAMPLF